MKGKVLLAIIREMITQSEQEFKEELINHLKELDDEYEEALVRDIFNNCRKSTYYDYPRKAQHTTSININKYTVLCGYSLEDGDHLIIYETNKPEIKIRFFGKDVGKLYTHMMYNMGGT